MSRISSLVVSAPVDDVTEQTVSSILDAYEDHAYQRGYSRGTRDLLAIYPLLIEQFLQQQNVDSPEVRKLIRAIGQFIEEKIDRNLTDAGFEGGEGI